VAELKRIHLTKADLDRIPGDERFFYLMAGHLGNDVNILGKLVMVAFNTAYQDGLILKDEPHGQAGLAQWFLLQKFLAGRLHEAFRLMNSHYFAKGLHTKYEPMMAERPRKSREQFSAYFAQKANIISRVRQKFAFHFERQDIEELYSNLEGEYAFVTYVGEHLGHNLFFGSEMLSLSAMAALANAPTPLQGMEKIYSDTLEVSSWPGYFVVGFMRVIVQQYIRPVRPEQIENMTIDMQGLLDQYTLPFFVSPPEKQTTSSSGT
jgi:hypothetical protein